MTLSPTSNLAAFKDAIGDALGNLPGLANVQVSTADPGKDAAAYEYISLIGEDLVDQEWAAIGKLSRDEVITLTGVIFVKKSGIGETAIREARTRCLALMAEIEKLFTGTAGDPSLGGLVMSAKARPVELHEIAGGDGDRVALLRFEIKTGLTRLVRA